MVLERWKLARVYGGDNGEYNGAGFVQTSKILAIYDEFFF